MADQGAPTRVLRPMCHATGGTILAFPLTLDQRRRLGPEVRPVTAEPDLLSVCGGTISAAIPGRTIGTAGETRGAKLVNREDAVAVAVEAAERVGSGGDLPGRD